MKLIALVVTALTVTSVQAAALKMPKWCHFPGQTCHMLKRANDHSGEVKRSADALAEAMPDASPEAMQKWCHFPGQTCAKVKRAADVVTEVKRSADALAEAMAALEEEE